MRLRSRRKELGITGEQLSKLIGKTGPYYRDIERGDCGMSVETLIQLSSHLGVSLDYVIYGNDGNGQEILSHDDMILQLLGRCDDGKRKVAVEMLKIYLQGMGS